jgi:hypothetical protein
MQDRWWPVQALPKSLVRTSDAGLPASNRLATEMLVQSAAGLAAKAVQDGRGDEMVWMENGNPDMRDWYERFLLLHTNISVGGSIKAWDLVDRYSKRGIIKGYILYRVDRSPGELNSHRPGMDCSVNVATSLAGILDGVIVAEELEQEAQARGLKLLLDAREKTQVWCFQNFRNRFNRRMLCTQDPKKPHVRDFAIRQRAFTFYGKGEPLEEAIQWLQPLSPILGWNGGDEFATTDLSTRYAHIQTATDWCVNLPVLMAGTEKRGLPQTNTFNPANIDWTDRRSGVSFIITDGDNVQWFEGNFFRGSQSYWGNPDRGKIPFGWSCCFAHLAQLCPEAIDYATTTRMPNDSFIEWGGGYYFPDRFGLDRVNRWDLLAEHARHTWSLMKKTDCRIIGFNFKSCESADARKACEVFAAQTRATAGSASASPDAGLLAILIFQYSAYEAGAGKVFWVKDGDGHELPVITARYSIWEHANNRERAGTPAKVAREIRQTVAKRSTSEGHSYDWVIVHAWSWFKRTPGMDEDGENMPQDDASQAGGVRGYTPAVWCAERLSPGIRVITPEEVAWRVRMLHDPERTKALLGNLPR